MVETRGQSETKPENYRTVPSTTVVYQEFSSYHFVMKPLWKWLPNILQTIGHLDTISLDLDYISGEPIFAEDRERVDACKSWHWRSFLMNSYYGRMDEFIHCFYCCGFVQIWNEFRSGAEVNHLIRLERMHIFIYTRCRRNRSLYRPMGSLALALKSFIIIMEQCCCGGAQWWRTTTSNEI